MSEGPIALLKNKLKQLLLDGQGSARFSPFSEKDPSRPVKKPDYRSVSTSQYLSRNEELTVKRYANGDQSVRDQVIIIYRSKLASGIDAQADTYMRYMSEVDNEYADITLREQYRREILSYQ